MSTAAMEGVEETLRYLDDLGARGDVVARRASTQAAADLRSSWMVQTLSGETGISRSVVLRNMALKRANPRYPDARINFSGSGVLVRDYRYRSRVVDARHNRAQIVLDWVGGTKVAAGFINPRGRKKTPLSTRSSRTTSRGKTYTYNRGRLVDALGPSIASAFKALPEDQVQQQAQARLAERLTVLLGELTGE